MPNPFNSALNSLVNQQNLTQADISKVFSGYEIHHVIPANFLWENETINKLLQQPGITFGFNNLDNLTYIPSSNHREGNKWCHNEYDEYIDQLIESMVKPLFNEARYEHALAALVNIIEEVRERFKNEVLKTDGITLDNLLQQP
jgi:hypothetical protein